MINLYDKASGALIGAISEDQLQFLMDQLEEESLEDRDYSITKMELDYFEAQGAPRQLVDLLRQALGGRDEVVVQWSSARTTP
jgi:processive 1,2-diacylglycerol beta-glucosyltransferase